MGFEIDKSAVDLATVQALFVFRRCNGSGNYRYRADGAPGRARDTCTFEERPGSWHPSVTMVLMIVVLARL